MHLMTLPVLEVSSTGYAAFGAVFMLILGAALAAILAMAGKFFKVEADPRVEQIIELLPGVNCGGCGFGGCAAYAEAIVAKGVAANLCAPGREAVAANIARVMGGKAEAVEAQAAVVHCGGGNKAARKAADYYGVQTCRGTSVPGLNSPKACLYGCLGFGDCVRACPFGAMVMGEDGLPQVLESLCVACGKCVAACPRNIIALHSKKCHVHVLCKNRDVGREVTRVCEVGCIACRKCEKACPSDAIHVVDNLAVIDYAKCTSCGKCAEECPQSIIVNWKQVRQELEKLQPAAAGKA